MHAALLAMTPAAYARYLDSIRRFLASPAALLFSREALVRILIEASTPAASGRPGVPSALGRAHPA
jgi:hypothetical protein